MKNRIRNGVLAATVAATVAVPVMPAAPAAAQTYDCRFMGPSYILQDAGECVQLLLMLLLEDPPLR